MFKQIQTRLLLSYLAVLTVVLGVFAISVRTTFAYNLNQQLNNRLATLARSAALELELDGGTLSVDLENITNENQAVQWFDEDGTLIESQGQYVATLPLKQEPSFQTQQHPYPVKALTIPVTDENKGLFLGYTRVSESTVAFNNTLRTLDIGLGSGIIAALALSTLGGLWLTRQAMSPIENSFRRLQRFTSDASHELRSPLMAIQTNATVALKYPENMRISDAEKFGAIKSASKQMKALTEDLLMLARLDQETVVKHTAFNLSPVLEQLHTLYQPQASTEQINFQVKFEPNLPTVGNKIQITRLLTNLIDNALRYTPEGGMVTVTAKSAPTKLIISVEDTGIGIAPDHLDHIFDRFWQADQARAYKKDGAGLGLAIAQNIAHSHGGEIKVISHLEQGSCFTIELPAG